MALTLADMASLAEDDLRKGVIFSIAKQTRLGEIMPIEEVTALDATVVYTSGLPSVSWRNVGGTPGESKATFAQHVEPLKALSAVINVDRLVTKAKNLVQDLRQTQLDAHTRSMAIQFNDTLINGDPTADAASPAGIVYRVANDPRFLNSTDATAVDLYAGYTDAKANQVLDIMDKCIEKVDGGDATCMLTNRQGKRNLSSILRQAKLLDTTKDMFGRRILSYMGVQIIDVGPKVSAAHLGSNYADSGQIIAYTANQACPVYFVKFDRDFVCTLQNGAPETEDFKVDPGSPQNMVAFVEWVVGLAVNRPDSIAAATGIKFLAAM